MAKLQVQQEHEFQSQFEEVEAYAQALEDLVQELLGLAESAKAHFGHYDEAWEKQYQHIKEQADHVLYNNG